MAESMPTCALCRGGLIPRRLLAIEPPGLRPYTAITFSLDNDYHHHTTIHLHDNCIVEYLDANPSIAIARQPQP